MQPSVEVRFLGVVRDRALEAAIHRWIARFEAMKLEVRDADATIERVRRHTMVSLTLSLTNGYFATTSRTYEDPYVAISDAFRAVRRELLARATQPPPLLAIAR